MSNKTILITGSSRGIGAAMARLFVSRGYRVIINANKSADSLHQLEQELNAAYPGCCTSFIGDMGDPSQVKALFQMIATQYGGLDVLINNAGIAYMGLLSDMTDAEWDEIIQTNLSSVFYCCRAAIPYMVQQKQGKILNISSVWGNAGASCETAYSASKGGVNAFTKALAKELAPSGIQVNAIAYGAIDTDMNQMLSDADRDSLCEEIPAGRFGTAEEAAQLALQVITSPTYLTGQILTMDGGWIS